MKTLPTTKMSPPMLPATSVEEKLICGERRCGSAGIGMFLMRLLAPGGRMFYEFDAHTSQAFEVNAVRETRS